MVSFPSFLLQNPLSLGFFHSKGQSSPVWRQSFCLQSFLTKTWKHMTQKQFAPWHLTDSHSMHTLRPTSLVMSLGSYVRAGVQQHPAAATNATAAAAAAREETSGHALGRALLLRGIRTLVWVRRRVQEVAAHVQGEGQQAAVQVHHHVLLSEEEEEGWRWDWILHLRTNKSCDWPGLSRGWAAGNQLSGRRATSLGCRMWRDVTWRRNLGKKKNTKKG